MKGVTFGTARDRLRRAAHPVQIANSEPVLMTLLDGNYEPLATGDPPPLLAVLLNVAAPFLALIDPSLSATVAAAGVVAGLFDRRSVDARLDALREAITSRAPALDPATLKEKLASEQAREAFTVAVMQTVFTPSVEKAKRFGAVLGYQLTDEQANWEQAFEFIRLLEQFTDSDLEALHTISTVQRSAWRMRSDNMRGGVRSQDLDMSTDANEYTQTWHLVLEAIDRARISRDEWYSRCSRLSGFGLVAMVQPNPSFQGPDAQCFRLTGRAVRLLRILGVVKDRY